MVFMEKMDRHYQALFTDNLALKSVNDTEYHGGTIVLCHGIFNLYIGVTVVQAWSAWLEILNSDGDTLACVDYGHKAMMDPQFIEPGTYYEDIEPDSITRYDKEQAATLVQERRTAGPWFDKQPHANSIGGGQ
jgi:hypothetical protein